MIADRLKYDMKLIDILDNSEWIKIISSLESSYPDITGDNLSLYHEVYKNLLKLKPIDTAFIICITEEYDKDFDDEPYTAISGRNRILNKDLSEFKNFKIDPESDYANYEVSYSLSLTDWNEWIGLVIDVKSLDTYNNNDIIAHCLWEMTFYGFDPRTIKNHEEELNRRVD